jgi:F-type H+-transporting ATPase subunit b
MNEELARQIGEIITHIVAFAIFFWVMAKFAWPAILKTIDDRQKKIQDGFDEVKRLQADAAETHKRYEEKLRGIEAEAREKINQAVADGKRVAAEMTDKARSDAVEIVAKAKQSIQLEIDSSRAKLREDVIRLTLQASERLLRERVDADKDRELVAGFIDDLSRRSS